MLKKKHIRVKAGIALIIVMLILPSTHTYSQDDFSWNDLVAWNGVTHWTNYLIVSPGYFGPNALPVPELKNGQIKKDAFFEFLGESHFSPGDKTYNLFFRYYHPFANSRIAVEFSMVPIEYYKLSSETRDKRKLRNSRPKGFAVGDLVFGTTIQLTKDKEKFPDLTLEMFCKTTSGGGLADARFTDHPAYYFNLNFGKDISGLQKFDKFRWYASVGFYNWQTNLDDYLQNDAPGFGIGFEIDKNNFEVHNQICGYYGYISFKNEAVVKVSEKSYVYKGDQPIVYRFQLLKKYQKFNIKFSYQKGLHDFAYNSVSLGFQYMPLK
ncbi:MAG: hypothetical protein U9R19_08715 [Bacteroidota bacterium]|nr:hypothetical protein [Bacteroidota bacterium]